MENWQVAQIFFLFTYANNKEKEKRKAAKHKQAEETYIFGWIDTTVEENERKGSEERRKIERKKK